MEEKVSVIGAGSWGTTLAIILSRKGIKVNLHSVFKEHNLQMQRTRQNSSFLKGAKFPKTLNINLSLKETLQNETIILAIPVKYLGNILSKIKKQKVIFKNKNIVSVAKGIETKSLKRPSELIEKALGKTNIAVLSGPNIAKEVLNMSPSAAILACRNKAVGEKLQLLFTNSSFRIYLHSDIIGVELGGALKNIIALSCGILDGLGFGTNTKAALLTRGLAEITRLGQKLGAKTSTFWGISGLGDLVTTCFSIHSRNRTVGEKIGKGSKITDIMKNMDMIAEGVHTVKPALLLGKRLGIDMPITNEVYNVLYKGKSPKKAAFDLMNRPLKAEKIG